MFVYRVANPKYKAFTLSGIGAEKVGGRWNKVGTPAVYCSENSSLALLEYYVHSENIAFLPNNILVAKIKIPDSFTITVLEKLPNNWDAYPYSSSTVSLFSKLAADSDFFALKVPSTIVRVESNFILNPKHKNFHEVVVEEYIEMPLDKRIYKG